MIEFLKTWVNQIILAVIISTIIEMILPNGNNKKYIKMIIGLYVLFTIIQPITTKITGKNLNISDFNYQKYFDQDTLETSSNDFEDNNSKLIKQAYIDNIKKDIVTKINQKGYKVESCSIEILDNENEDTYGTIKSISLRINNKEDEEKESNNIINIENVDINVKDNKDIENNNEITKKNNLSDKEKIEIIKYLSEEYSVDLKNILIN